MGANRGRTKRRVEEKRHKRSLNSKKTKKKLNQVKQDKIVGTKQAHVIARQRLMYEYLKKVKEERDKQVSAADKAKEDQASQMEGIQTITPGE